MTAEEINTDKNQRTKRLVVFVDDFCCSAVSFITKLTEPGKFNKPEVFFSSRVIMTDSVAVVFHLKDADKQIFNQFEIGFGLNENLVVENKPGTKTSRLRGLSEVLESGSVCEISTYLCALVQACILATNAKPESDNMDLFIAIPYYRKKSKETCEQAVQVIAKILRFRQGTLGDAHVWAAEQAFGMNPGPRENGCFAVICLWRSSLSMRLFATKDIMDGRAKKGEDLSPKGNNNDTKFEFRWLEQRQIDSPESRRQIAEYMKPEPARHLVIYAKRDDSETTQIVMSGASFPEEGKVDAISEKETLDSFEWHKVDNNNQPNGAEHFLLIGSLALHLTTREAFHRSPCLAFIDKWRRASPFNQDPSLAVDAVLTRGMNPGIDNPPGNKKQNARILQAGVPSTDSTTVLSENSKHRHTLKVEGFKMAPGEKPEVTLSIDTNMSDRDIDAQLEFEITENDEIFLRAWVQGATQGKAQKRKYPISVIPKDASTSPKIGFPRLVYVEAARYSLILSLEHEEHCKAMKKLNQLKDGGVHIFNHQPASVEP